MILLLKIGTFLGVIIWEEEEEEMSEAAKIRLVRCPKCQNLLPEVTDFSVYQCGGCGAVLRAKNKNVNSSERSEGIVGTAEKLTDGYDKIVDVSDRRALDTSDGSESDVRSSVSSFSRTAGAGEIRENSITKETGLVVDEHCSEIDRGFRENEDVRIGKECQTNGSWRRMEKEEPIGPSSSSNPSSYSDETAARNGTNNIAVVEEFDNVGRDRAELLKKLDELKDQLSRSGNLGDKGKEKIPHESRRIDPYWHHPDDRRASMQNPYPDFPFARNQYVEPPPSMHRPEIGAHFYPSTRHVPGYGDPSMSQVHRRPSAAYQMYPSRPYRSGPYRDDTMAYVEPSYPPDFGGHHPTCSCYRCFQKMPAMPYDGVFGYLDNPGSFGSRTYGNHRRPGRIQNAQTRWPSDVDSDIDGFLPRRRPPPRVHFLAGGKHRRPVAGGVPILTCNNCFELLLLPKRVLVKDDGRKRMRCGACSSLIIFTVSDRSLVVSYEVEAEDNNPNEVEDILAKHPSQVRTTFSSEDYDNYGYDFCATVRESEQPVTRQGSNRRSTSTYASEADEDSGSADLSTKNKRCSPPLGSSLQDHFEHSNNNHATYQSKEGNGNRSGRSEHEKQLPSKATSRQISAATEIDLSSNEFGNTGATFDSGEGSREGDQLKGSRGAESFFAGIIKKSFKDKWNDEKASVTVNGHLITNRTIKKAEKVAGPIHPGHYWYDFRAGFWGVMGGPCLGIIPPFIEELNYPMPDGCAGGNTGVFVNGRELNQKDLTLLGSRGLPTERDRSFIIEISGRVLDEDTGEELDGLGKLAPTVERMKRGFGMRAPKAAAA
ncbi:protein ENHANCED DISEASE RESISTANCE 4-like [Andrographis paniculata]|uniref:protein ENHANCED DISEASE RESISTANCE 4-like n=1 Tax=Andrographis paniculata TaxID=175694 RepID=UPI0021E84F41|nr:protein ENHANCED DISEASE RESISTANCE 4-like [Andrographis paniculata]XP_051148300.1 protein ENHANCED DISEASE RESISTANCE 4-like [Andrographis paniculata]XP_051148308.1 protein ENHANCED DISEASE RESISTANCE 4-like [Andrographis paniculata]